MIVDRRDLHPPRHQGGQHRRQLRLQEDEVAHRHRLVGAHLEEGAPGAERQGRLDRHVADLDAQVPPRPAEAMDAAGEVLARNAEDAVDLLPDRVGGLLGAQGERRQEGENQGQGCCRPFHAGFLLRLE